MRCKPILFLLFGNLAVVTVLHNTGSVDCINIFRRRIHTASRRHYQPYHQHYNHQYLQHVPYNIYGPPPTTSQTASSTPSYSPTTSLPSPPPSKSPALVYNANFQPISSLQYSQPLPNLQTSSSYESPSYKKFTYSPQVTALQPYHYNYAGYNYNNNNNMNFNDQMLRRQLFVGNGLPLSGPIPFPVIGKSRRLFSNFVNLRQSQLITSVLAGPLALATVLFTLPLLPSLLMAPLAFAGIPQAMTMMQDFMHSVSGGGKPINHLINHFIDPLVSPLGVGGAPGTESSGKPTKASIFKHIARIFRVGINRRVASPPPQSDNSTTLSSIEPTSEGENIIDENDLPIVSNTTLYETLMSPSGNDSDHSPLPSSTSSSVLHEGGPSAESANSILQAIPESTLNQLNNGELKKTSRAMDNMFLSIKEIYGIIREGLRRYEITDAQCQSRIVCEIHQKIVGRKRSMLKSFALNAIDVLSIESRIDGMNNLNDKSKETIKVYIAAAKKGLADENCDTEFDKCPTLPLKSRMLRSLVLDSGHIIKTIKRSL